MKKARKELSKDLSLIFLGAFVAYILSETGSIDILIKLLGNSYFASFMAGLFFTSVFTIAPASVALAHLSTLNSIPSVAIWGALGAVCGDLILFFFIRDKFTDDLLHSVRPSLVKHLFRSLHLGFLKWLSPILGAIIIASPLPDELGLALLGMSKVKTALLIPISLIMNFIGIYAIGYFGSIL